MERVSRGGDGRADGQERRTGRNGASSGTPRRSHGETSGASHRPHRAASGAARHDGATIVVPELKLDLPQVADVPGTWPRTSGLGTFNRPQPSNGFAHSAAKSSETQRLVFRASATTRCARQTARWWWQTTRRYHLARHLRSQITRRHSPSACARGQSRRKSCGAMLIQWPHHQLD